jgi:DNA-binding XRE family transcriptional regulator
MAVQIVHPSHPGAARYRVLGSAHNAAELEVLKGDRAAAPGGRAEQDLVDRTGCGRVAVPSRIWSRHPANSPIVSRPEMQAPTRCPYFQAVIQRLQMQTPHTGGSADQPCRIYTAASLGTAIRHYRLQSGLSQAKLAERTGLHRTYLSDLEQGKETEQVRRILRVLKELGVRMTLEKANW